MGELSAESLAWTGSSDEEVELLNHILEVGFDQGCVIRPDEDCFIPGAMVHDYLTLMRRREQVRASVSDPHMKQRLRRSYIEGTEDAYMILTQRCDLVRCLAVEPFVELARVSRGTDGKSAEGTTLNSPRLIFLPDEDPDYGWIADLRDRVQLPKQYLMDSRPYLPLERGATRSHLADKIGRRFSRHPVSDDIVADIQTPMRNYLRKRKKDVATRLFSDVLARRNADESIYVIVVKHPEADLSEAEDFFEPWLDFLRNQSSMTIDERSKVELADRLSFGFWLEAENLDFFDLSSGSRLES